MSTIKDGGPAFPCSQRRDEKYMDEGGAGRTRTVTVNVGGMTLRDYFAAKAMNGICSSGPTVNVTDAVIAAESYRIADAMLAAREAQP